jgi:hypothetical protein
MNTPITPPDGGPAFPVPEMHFGNDTKQACDAKGLSLRAYIATAALQGMHAAQDQTGLWFKEDNRKFLAEIAVKQADALIAELNK